MAKIYYDQDIELDTLTGISVGVIGYGNQGRAHALNLKESGIHVRTGFRSNSQAREQAEKDGFRPEEIETVAANCDILSILLPDESIPTVYMQSIEPYLSSNATFVFAHGFAVHHRTIRLPDTADVLLVAPTGPGRQLRSLYVQGRGLPALIAVEQDPSGNALPHCLAYAKAIGCTRAGVVLTTFAEETIVDLFCEQAVLCGGIPQLIKSSFETLVQSGYQPELAYISCLKEVKLIADLLFESGVDGMRTAISNTAKFGSAKTRPFLIDGNTQHKLKLVLESIETGAFAKDFQAEATQGSPTINELLRAEKQSLIARTGHALKESLDF